MSVSSKTQEGLLASDDGELVRPPAEPACPLCDGGSSLLYAECSDLEYFIERPFGFRRCSGCGFVFMDPLPSREELPDLYPPNYHNFDAVPEGVRGLLIRRFYAHHAALIRRYLRPGGSLLEVGSATGEVLDRVGTSGYRVRGVEISADGCEAARQKGLDVFHGTLDEFETEERFDMVFMSHVIEHVIDPVATVDRIYDLLVPGGIVYLETPNVRSLDARLWGRHWGLIHFPRHLYLFDPSTLRGLLERAGFAVEATRWELNSCGWALSIQSLLRRRGLDRSREPRSFYYPLLLVLCMPLNAIDLLTGGTAFMGAVGRKPVEAARS